jgi:DNA repair exonuclease SbcCD ATPase subunit
VHLTDDLQRELANGQRKQESALAKLQRMQDDERAKLTTEVNRIQSMTAALQRTIAQRDSQYHTDIAAITREKDEIASRLERASTALNEVTATLTVTDRTHRDALQRVTSELRDAIGQRDELKQSLDATRGDHKTVIADLQQNIKQLK